MVKVITIFFKKSFIQQFLQSMRIVRRDKIDACGNKILHIFNRIYRPYHRQSWIHPCDISFQYIHGIIEPPVSDFFQGSRVYDKILGGVQKDGNNTRIAESLLAVQYE
jgi:hypothetical protein